MRTKLAFVVLALLALSFAGACGSDDDTSADTPAETSDGIGDPAGQPGPDAPTVSINSPEILVGGQGEAVLTVLNFGAPGLGAWTVDVAYDTSVVSVVACTALPEGNVCNEAFADDVVRVVGAVAVGLEGDSVIGRLTFQCDVAGESKLNVSIDTFADGTIGEPQELDPFVENGAIICTE